MSFGGRTAVHLVCTKYGYEASSKPQRGAGCVNQKSRFLSPFAPNSLRPTWSTKYQHKSAPQKKQTGEHDGTTGHRAVTKWNYRSSFYRKMKRKTTVYNHHQTISPRGRECARDGAGTKRRARKVSTRQAGKRLLLCFFRSEPNLPRCTLTHL